MPFDYVAAIPGLEIIHAKDVFDGINAIQLQTPHNEVTKFATIAISAGILADLMRIYIEPTEGCCFGWMYFRRHNIHYAKEIKKKAIEVKKVIVYSLSQGADVDLEQLKIGVNQVLQAINLAFDQTKNPAGINPIGDFAKALTAFLNKYWQIKYPMTFIPPSPVSSSRPSRKSFSRSLKRVFPSFGKKQSTSKNSVQLTETSQLLSGQVLSPTFGQPYQDLAELQRMIALCHTVSEGKGVNGEFGNVGDSVWSGNQLGGQLILSQYALNALRPSGLIYFQSRQ